MPLVKATLGTALVVGSLGMRRVGERNPAVSADVGMDDGIVDFPLDHVVLAARRVRARGAAVLWAAAVDAAWQLAGGAPLDASALDEIVRPATGALAVFSTAPKALPLEVRTSRREGACELDATTNEPIPPFTIKTHTPTPIPAGSTVAYSLQHSGSIALGDRVHVSGEIDGEVVYLLNTRAGAGIYAHVRTADGRIVGRRRSETRLADARDVAVVIGDNQHTLAARTSALGDGYDDQQGVALLTLVHSGCPCELRTATS